jgi:hypothetical protein
MRKESNILKKTLDAAKQVRREYSVSELTSLSKSNDARERLFALAIMRRQIKYCDSAVHFGMARPLIRDSDNNCRWQALVLISEFLESDPAKVWSIVREFGNSEDEDMRMGVATLLLEHLLEIDFKTYFTKVRDEIKSGKRRFINTLELCSCFGNDYQRKVESFIRKARRALVQ